MPGGSVESYEPLGPIFESIAARVDGTPCCVHVGPDGAGHFVKMVHNGIEYADMQLIAEAYDLLRAGLEAPARRDRRHLPGLERRRSRVVPHRDHRRRAVAHRRHAPVGRSSTSSLDEAEQKGTGPVDRAERPRPRRPDHRHRRGDLRPVAVRPHRAAPPAREATFGGRHVARRRRRPGALRRGRAPGAVRLEGRRLRPGVRPDPWLAATSTAGTSTPGRWPRSGGVAASSGPGSSTGSRRPTTMDHRPRCWSRRSSPT